MAVETEVCEIEYFLDVSSSTVSGVQEWGPFATADATTAVAASLASRGDITKVVVRKEAK